MNLKLIWLFWDLYQKLQKVRKESIMDLGWKTITGAVMMGLGYACKAMASAVPALDVVGDALVAIGVALGGIGIRSAIAKK